MNTIDKKVCPEVHRLEAYVSNQLPSVAEHEEISEHLTSCRRCQALASELYQYYKILEREKHKPVHHAVFKLVKTIDPDQVIIAGILLQPNRVQKNQQSIQYQAEVVLVTQKDNAEALDDLDCIPIDDNEIFIRAVQSARTNETTLFLYANDEKLYRNVKLQIEPGSETFSSDDIGKIELGPFDINTLNEQPVILIPKNL